MRIVISQPMYLPWIGLFNQLKHAQVFVHLDDVNIPQGRSFITRVQLKGKNSLHWLTVPVVRSSRNKICDVLIDDSKNWRESHFNKIICSLNSSDYFAEMLSLVKSIIFFKTSKLSELNIYGIEKIAKYLGLECKFILASQLNINKKSSEKILSILKLLRGDCYITGHGARHYLDYVLLEKEKISVKYIDYKILAYKQNFGSFLEYVSIIDAISHRGKNVNNHMLSNLVDWRDFLNERRH
ncbi:MAG: WbqC family protein [Pseudomonadota bacterium]